MNPRCRACRALLTPKNWGKSERENHSNICRVCRVRASVEWIRTHPDAHRRIQRNHHRTTAYVRRREANWAKAGITEVNGKPLRWETFRAVVSFQGGRCPISGVDENWESLVADHDHRTGLFRGALARAANHHGLASFERTGHYKDEFHESVLLTYLSDPPYGRWLRAGSPKTSDEVLTGAGDT